MSAAAQKRKIGPTRRSVSGFYMFRGESAVEFESTLERDFIIRHEAFPSVAQVVAQPCQVRYWDPVGRRFQTYTPDFLVHFRLGCRQYGNYPKPMLVEVKPEEHWRRHWRKWLPKWRAALRFAREQGWAFHIYDESRIRDEILERIRFLKRYERAEFPPEESAAILQTVKEMDVTTLDFLLARHFIGDFRCRAVGIAHLWHLLATGGLAFDLNEPLSQFTKVWVPRHG